MEHGMGGTTSSTCGCPMEAMFKMLPWKIIMHADELGLSEEQVDAFRNQHADLEKRMIQLGSEIKIGMIDVKNCVILREEIDLHSVESKVREIGKLKGDMLMAKIKAMQEMRKILTPDQRKKVKEMVKCWFKKGMPDSGTPEH